LRKSVANHEVKSKVEAMNDRSIIEAVVQTRSYEKLLGLQGRNYDYMWILFQRYVLTQDGIILPVVDTKLAPGMSMALSVEDLRLVHPEQGVRYTPKAIPSSEDTCGHCGKRFEVLDAFEAVMDREGTDRASNYSEGENHSIVRKWWHKKCHAFEGKKDAVKRFSGACDEVFGAGNYVLNSIPNEYWKDAAAEPWFLAETQGGVTFKFGWRKRVINLDWSAWVGGPRAEKFAPFKDFDVTKDGSIIHAYSMEHFKQHLKALYDLSLLTPKEALEKALFVDEDLVEMERALRATDLANPYSEKGAYWGPKIPLPLLRATLTWLERESVPPFPLWELKDLIQKRSQEG